MITSHSSFKTRRKEGLQELPIYLYLPAMPKACRNCRGRADALVYRRLMEVQEHLKLEVTVVRKIQRTLSASTEISSGLWGCCQSSSFSFSVIESPVLKDTVPAFCFRWGRTALGLIPCYPGFLSSQCFKLCVLAKFQTRLVFPFSVSWWVGILITSFSLVLLNVLPCHWVSRTCAWPNF